MATPDYKMAKTGGHLWIINATSKTLKVVSTQRYQMNAWESLMSLASHRRSSKTRIIRLNWMTKRKQLFNLKAQAVASNCKFSVPRAMEIVILKFAGV